MSDQRVFKFRPTAIVAVAVLGVALGSSYIVGRGGTQHAGDFDWSLAVEAGIAVGTTLLAGFTGALARSTSRDVTATMLLADRAQEDALLRDRPSVVLSDVNWAGGSSFNDGYRRSFVVDVQNIGLGPAFRIGIAVRPEAPFEAAVISPTPAKRVMLGPGKGDSIEFTATRLIRIYSMWPIRS